MAEYRLLYSETSRNQIKNLHPEIKPIIRSRLDRLQKKPFSGKRLEKELSGYRSLRARRFRIIYKLNEETKTIETDMELYLIGSDKQTFFKNLQESRSKPTLVEINKTNQDIDSYFGTNKRGNNAIVSML